MDNIGGVGIREVIGFQTRVMMGAQYDIIANATEQKDIIIACLRVGWNDAFRHTSENVKTEGSGKSVLEIEMQNYKVDERYYDFICAKILNDKNILDVFSRFALAESTEAKASAITDGLGDVTECFKPYKNTDGDKKLCFGHIQKMFNIALKLYLCLYVCREYLDIGDGLFDEAVINNLRNADCPVDGIILGKLGEGYRDYKWSKISDGEEYIDIQNRIREELDDNGNSNLYYDFTEWNKR